MATTPRTRPLSYIRAFERIAPADSEIWRYQGARHPPPPPKAASYDDLFRNTTGGGGGSGSARRGGAGAKSGAKAKPKRARSAGPRRSKSVSGRRGGEEERRATSEGAGASGARRPASARGEAAAPPRSSPAEPAEQKQSGDAGAAADKEPGNSPLQAPAPAPAQQQQLQLQLLPQPAKPQQPVQTLLQEGELLKFHRGGGGGGGGGGGCGGGKAKPVPRYFRLEARATAGPVLMWSKSKASSEWKTIEIASVDEDLHEHPGHFIVRPPAPGAPLAVRALSAESKDTWIQNIRFAIRNARISTRL